MTNEIHEVKEKAIIGWVIYRKGMKAYYAISTDGWFYTSEVRQAQFFNSHKIALDTIKYETLRENAHDIIEMELVWSANPAEKLQLGLDLGK